MPKMSTILKAKTKSLSKHWVESALDEILLEDSKQEYKKTYLFPPFLGSLVPAVLMVSNDGILPTPGRANRLTTNGYWDCLS